MTWVETLLKAGSLLRRSFSITFDQNKASSRRGPVSGFKIQPAAHLSIAGETLSNHDFRGGLLVLRDFRSRALPDPELIWSLAIPIKIN
jgi:hypothetical protein